MNYWAQRFYLYFGEDRPMKYDDEAVEAKPLSLHEKLDSFGKEFNAFTSGVYEELNQLRVMVAKLTDHVK